MASESNGDKSKIIIFLVGVLQTIVMGWCWWAGAAIVEAKTNIAELKASYSSILRELTEIKDLVKVRK